MAAHIDGLSADEAKRIEAEFARMPKDEKVRVLENPGSSNIGPERRYLMVLGMEDSEPGVRRAAASFLNWTGKAPDLLPYLLKFVRLETEPITKGLIVFVLCNHAGDPGASEALVEVLKTDGDDVTEWVYRHMETWSEMPYWGRQKREVWKAAIDRQPLPQQHKVWLAKGLRQAANIREEAVDALNVLADDEAFEVREAAKESLRRLKALS